MTGVMGSVKKHKEQRKKIYDELFGAAALCAAGLLIIPAILFNPAPIYRLAQFLFFWFLCWLAGKKNNPFITLIIITVIIAFNLIIPYGRVMFSIGVFKITEGALMTGIQRAATLEGLIMLSRLTVRQDFRIPGAFGELIGESLRMFSMLMESKPRITIKNLIKDIDNLLMELSSSQTERPAGAAKIKTGPAGFAVLAAAVIAAWLPWIFLI
ncbi:MAG: hypothetical protein FWD78_11580 [Treponema sp.]|nr:hypothetical protein [Treponema sp.]